MNVHLYTYELPFSTPITLARRSYADRRGLLLQLSSGPREGWGEAAPLPGFSRESEAEAREQLLGLLPKIRSLDPRATLLEERSVLLTELNVPSLLPSVRNAIEGAILWWLMADTGRLPGRALNKEVELNALLVVSDNLDGTLQDLRRDGYQGIKMKVGRRSVAEDLRRLRQVAAEIERGVKIRLDANRAWSWDQAVSFLEGLPDGLPLDYIEEPLRNPDELERLRQVTGAPIALDETLRELKEDDLAGYSWVDAWICKPMLDGGPSAFFAIERAAEKSDAQVILSSAFDSGVGMRNLLMLAGLALRPAPMGLDTYKRLRYDVLEEPLPYTGARADLTSPSFRRPTISRNHLQRISE